jgi:hypothetical protein
MEAAEKLLLENVNTFLIGKKEGRLLPCTKSIMRDSCLVIYSMVQLKLRSESCFQFLNMPSLLIKSYINYCAAGFALLNLPKGKSLGRSKPETNSYEQALATHCVGFLLYPSSAELPYAK